MQANKLEVVIFPGDKHFTVIISSSQKQDKRSDDIVVFRRQTVVITSIYHNETVAWPPAQELPHADSGLAVHRSLHLMKLCMCHGRKLLQELPIKEIHQIKYKMSQNGIGLRTIQKQ